jgi:hypothetical protein
MFLVGGFIPQINQRAKIATVPFLTHSLSILSNAYVSMFDSDWQLKSWSDSSECKQSSKPNACLSWELFFTSDAFVNYTYHEIRKLLNCMVVCISYKDGITLNDNLLSSKHGKEDTRKYWRTAMIATTHSWSISMNTKRKLIRSIWVSTNQSGLITLATTKWKLICHLSEAKVDGQQSF